VNGNTQVCEAKAFGIALVKRGELIWRGLTSRPAEGAEKRSAKSGSGEQKERGKLAMGVTFSSRGSIVFSNP
jgi:hypothetical protein